MEKVQINKFGEALYKETLENGIKVYLFPIKRKKSFACMYLTKYGGACTNFKVEDKEYKTPTGIAHFLEHKMFEQKQDPFSYFAKFGADLNASTSSDYTGYYFTGNRDFNKCLIYVLNWLKQLNITDKLVEKEQGIILEEANMYKDNPERVLYNKIKENIFINDPNKYKTIGTDEDIVSITKEELKLCYDTFYKPNNMSLIITGNINPEKTLKIIKEETKDLKKQTKNIEILFSQEPNKVAKEYEEIKMNIKTPKVALGYKIPKTNFKDLNIKKVELDIYMHSIFDIALGTTSEIREKWLEQNLFTRSYYRISESNDYYVVEFYSTTNKEQELLKEFLEYMNNNLKLDKESFEREKKLWIANEIKITDSPSSMLYSILDDILDYEDYIDNKSEIIKNLNYETLNKVKDRLNFDNKVIIKILPNNL